MLTEIEHEDRLAIFVVVAGRGEPHVTPERLRAVLARYTAREEPFGTICACDLRDEPDRLAAEALALVPLVHDQLPEEPGPDDPRRVRDGVPAQHDESDGLVICVHRSVPRLRLRDFVGVSQGARHCSDELLLLGGNTERKDGISIARRYLAKGHAAHGPENRRPRLDGLTADRLAVTRL